MLKIFFLTLSLPNSICILISRQALEEKSLRQSFTEDTAVRYSLETSKNDTITPYQNLSKKEWFPRIEGASTGERKAPSFLEYLLKLGSKESNLRLDPLVDSFVQDFLHGVTRGKMITPK